MTHDEWLEAPYNEQAKREAEAERIYAGYSRKDLFPEFLIIFGEELKDDNAILNAVQQRDFEAVGGLLLAAFEAHLSDLADYDAEVQNW